MQTQVQNEKRLEKSLDLAFPLAEVDSEVETRLKRLARTVRIPGFRPGKVPMTIVARQYGGQVRQEVVGDSIQRAFSNAVREQNIRVAGYPRFEEKVEPAGEGKLAFTATFEVYPDVALGDMKGVNISRPVTVVLDEDVDKTIGILRRQRATFSPVDRPAASGDQVLIDYRGTQDGVAFDGGSAEDQLIPLGEGRLLADFESNLVGLAPGGSKTFDLTFPADYHAQHLAGKVVQFEVKVKDVQQIVLPEVDADFARTLGVEDGDVAKMRAEIKANLEREVKKRVQARLKDQVMQGLLDRNPIDVPQALVDMEVQRLAEAAVEDLKSRGLAQAANMQLPPDLFTDQAKRRVALGLVLAELVKRENLSAKPEQVRAVLEEHAQSYEKPAEMVSWYYQQPERLREVEALVVEDNVVDWVIDGAIVEDVPTPFDELMGQQKNVG